MDEMLNAAQLREALVSYRKAHKLTREEFAEKSGLSKWWVEKFEQGAIVEPKLGRARELSQFLREDTKRPFLGEAAIDRQAA